MRLSIKISMRFSRMHHFQKMRFAALDHFGEDFFKGESRDLVKRDVCFIGHKSFRFANKKAFIFVFGVVGLVFASSHAYYNGTITTMEKRFKIPSRNMGFIATGNDITGFILSTFIAYYGGRGKESSSSHRILR